VWMKNGDNDNPTHANPRNKTKEGMEEQDVASSYKRWLETLDEIIDGLSDSAKRKFWAANAKRIYHL